MKKCLVMLLLSAFLAISAFAETKITGTWQLVELKRGGINPGTFSDPQPGLLIFTEKHYSLMLVTSDKPRIAFPDTAKATAPELQAILEAFTANTGTYDLAGDTLTLRPTIAKSPALMSPGSSIAHSFIMDGDTLTLAMTHIVPSGNPPASPTTSMKFKRIE